MEHDGDTTATWESSEYNVTAEFRIIWPVTVLSVLQGLATAAGLLVNALLLLLLATSPRQRTVSIMFLLQRAVAEVIDLIAMVFFITVRESTDFKPGPVMCLTFSIAVHVGTMASPVFLLLFTMDSYLASRPQHHTLASRRKVMWLTSAAAWFLAAAVGVAAYFLTYYDDDGHCTPGPFFGMSGNDFMEITEMCVHLVVPLVVVWVFVSLTLPLRSALFEGEHKGPNRRLLLSLPSTFSLLHGVYWFVSTLWPLLPFNNRFFYIIEAIAYSLPTFAEVINPILVIYLSEGLRQKMAGWLLPSQTPSTPLQDL